MIKHNSIRGYWLLINILCFPFSWLKWFAVIGVVLVLIGLPLAWLKNNPAGVVVGGLFIFAQLMVDIIYLPSQMISINSSKQLGYLEGLRQKSLVILFWFCV